MIDGDRAEPRHQFGPYRGQLGTIRGRSEIKVLVACGILCRFLARAYPISCRPFGSIVTFCLVLLMCQINDEVILSSANDFYRAEVIHQKKSACSPDGKYVLQIMDLQSGRVWKTDRDLLDGRSRGISTDILAVRWISKDSLHVERRVTDNGLRGDLIYKVSSQTFVNVSLDDSLEGKSR